jgi:hypothetical protein
MPLALDALPADAARADRLTSLRAELRARFPSATPLEAPAADGLSTGLPALDRLLPHGGLPRGQVTEWVAERSGGSATLVRQVSLATAARGEPVAIVDARATLAAADWVEAYGRGGIVLVRPDDPADAAFCAEQLLRSGALALLVLDGVAPGEQLAQRLALLAREHETAVVLVLPADLAAGRGGSPLAAVRLRLAPPPAPATPPGPPGLREPVPLRVALRKGGPPDDLEVPRVCEPSHRLCAHPLAPDRRVGARRGRSW